LRSSGLTALIGIAGALTGIPTAAVAQAPCSGDKTGATLDQYCEAVPTADERRGASDAPGASRMPSSGRPIPSRTAEVLHSSALGRVLVAGTSSGHSAERGAGGASAGEPTRRARPTDDASRRRTGRPGIDAAAGHAAAEASARLSVRDTVAAVPLAPLAGVVLLLTAAAAAGLARARRGPSA
jgi:hypothetical protein